jgi:rhodanese-related sulfurtransferase/peroxiredoxin
MDVLRDMLRFSPLDVGDEAPPLSLTADEGTWIKLRDFGGHLNVVLVFFRAETPETEAWLQDLETQRSALEQLDCTVFAVNSARTDRLREFRSHTRSGFYFLYDPLALTSRAFGMARKVRPFCRDGVCVVDKDQRVLLCERGMVPASRLVELLSEHMGRSVEAAKQAEVSGDTKGAAVVQDIDSIKAEALLDRKQGYKLVDVRTLSEFEPDHSPEAIHLPIDELPHRHRELEQGDRIIFVCQGGDRSAAAAEFMTSIGGHDIYNVLGGMGAWTGRREASPVRED